MANEGYPGGGGGGITSAAQMLLALTGASTLAAGALLYGDGDASLATLTLGAQNTVLVAGASAPAWSTSLALTSTIASKQAAAAGISLDHNSATGNFTHRLSPANLTANRRTTFGDGDFAFTGGGTLALAGFTLTVPATGTLGLLGTAQTWSAVQTFTLAPVMSALTASRLLRTDASKGLESNAALTSTHVLYADANGWPTGSSNFVYSGGIVTITNSTTPLVLGITVATNFSEGLTIRKRGATGDANAALASASEIGYHSFYGWDGTAYGRGALVRARTTEAWTSSAHGCRYEIWTCPNGSTSDTIRVTIDQDGTVTLAKSSGAALNLSSTEDSTSTSTGALVSSGGAGFAKQVSAQNLLLTMGTITSAEPVLDSTVTWNNGAVTFTAWKLNVTNTASAAGSLLLDLQVGGNSQFSVRKDSLVTMAGLAHSGSADGQFWHDSSEKSLKGYVGGIQRSLVGTLYLAGGSGTTTGPDNTLTETSITNTATSFGTLTLPASFFVANKRVRVRITGRYQATGAPTLTIRLKLGSTAINTSTRTMPTSSGKFAIDAVMWCVTTGGAGSIDSDLFCVAETAAGDAFAFGNAASNTIDTGATQAISVTAQFSAADPSNECFGLTASVEVLN